MRRETRSATAVMALPSRCVRSSTTVSLSPASRSRSKRPPTRRGSRVPAARSVQPSARKRGSAPRKVCTATSGSPRSTMRGPPRAMTRSTRAAAEVSSWASSTTTSRDPLVQPRERRRVVVEQLGDGGEHPGGVVGAVPTERGDLVVLTQHPCRRHPFRAAVLGAEPGEVVGPEPELDRAHQQVTQLVAEAAGRQRFAELDRPRRPRHVPRGVPGEQVAQDDVLLRPVEQPRRRVATQRRLGAQHAEAEGLPGARQRLGRRAAESCGDLLAQRRRGAAARGQHEARVGPQTVPAHGVDDQLDGHRGLAGARPAQDPQHARGRVQCPLLALVEPHLHRGDGRSSAEDDHRRIPSRTTDSVLGHTGRAAQPHVGTRGARDGIRHPGPQWLTDHSRSKRSASMTLVQAATKSWTNFSWASSLAYTSARARSCEFDPKMRSTGVAVHFRSPVARSRIS